MKQLAMGVLILMCAITACRSNSIEDQEDVGYRRDSGGYCLGGSPGTAFELPEGNYTGTLSANDTASCGIASSGNSEDQLVEVKVTKTSVTVEPDKPMQVSIVRNGNKLCGTSQREYRLTINSNLCIIDETDRINGEVTAPGEFWVDLDFEWKRKGGVCNSLTLPCAGRTTWTFLSNVSPPGG